MLMFVEKGEAVDMLMFVGTVSMVTVDASSREIPLTLSGVLPTMEVLSTDMTASRSWCSWMKPTIVLSRYVWVVCSCLANCNLRSLKDARKRFVLCFCSLTPGEFFWTTHRVVPLFAQPRFERHTLYTGTSNIPTW